MIEVFFKLDRVNIVFHISPNFKLIFLKFFSSRPISSTFSEILWNKSVEKPFGAMKYFQEMRKPFDILNIYPNTLGQVHGLNMKNYFFLIVSGSSFTWSVIFMVFQAKTVTEFAESFYVFSIGLFVFVIFAIFFAKKKDIFNLIDEYEWTIQKRMIFFSVFYWNS